MENTLPQQQPVTIPQPTQPYATNENVKKFSKSKKTIAVIALGVILISVIGLILFLQNRSHAREPIMLPKPAVTSDKNWDIYTNSQLEFSIKALPLLKHSVSMNTRTGIKDLTEESFTQGVLTECCGYDGPNLIIKVFPENGNEEWAEYTVEPDDTLSAMTISNETVKKLSGPSGVRIGPLKHNGKLYLFEITGKDKTEKDFEPLYHMLSTFMFIASVSPSPSCTPRPSCIDTPPFCKLAITKDMCVAITMTPKKPYPVPVTLAVKQLAALAKTDISQITVISTEKKDWPDSSLGCPKKGMMYSQLVTPGYKVTLEYKQSTYEFHTNVDQVVVLCSSYGASSEGR